METAIVLAYLGACYFYAYLSLKLPRTFAPLKLAYLIISQFFLILLFGNLSMIVNNSINDISNLAWTVVYGNGIILAITIAYILIMIIFKRVFETVQEAVEKVEKEG